MNRSLGVSSTTAADLPIIINETMITGHCRDIDIAGYCPAKYVNPKLWELLNS